MEVTMTKNNKKTNTTTSIDSDLSVINTTSGKIRYLTMKGWTRSAIAKHLNIRYQHVRNVQLQPLKKS